MKKTILFALLWISFSSCFKNYFSIKSTSEITASDWEKITAPGKTVILHTDNKTVELVDIRFSQEKIDATALPHYPLKPNYENPDPSRKNHIYKKAHKEDLMNQVHIYTNADFSGNPAITLEKNQISKLSVYKPAKTATTLSNVGGVLAIVTGVFVVMVGIAAATWSFSM